MESKTSARQEYKGKIYVKNIGEKMMLDPKQDPDPKPTEK
jgi:hypothetical protein